MSNEHIYTVIQTRPAYQNSRQYASFVFPASFCTRHSCICGCDLEGERGYECKLY